MAIPALQALSLHFILHIIGPSWVKELYSSFCSHFYEPKAKPQCYQIVLFKPSVASAWRNRHYSKRIGLGTGIRDHLLTDSIIANGHRIDCFNALASYFGIEPNPLPTFEGNEIEAPTLPDKSVLCIVGTNSPRTVRWKYFSALAHQSNREFYFLGGPGDEKIIATLKKDHNCLPTNLSLSQVARLSRTAEFIVGIDSGLTHLAVAARNVIDSPESTNLILYGSTSPSQTGPRNCTAIYDTRPACWPCYKKTCSINTPCLETPISMVDHLL